MINVHTVHFTADKKLLDFVNEKISKLKTFNDTITSIDVYLKLENTSDHVKDKVVELKINVLNNKIFVKESTKTFENSLQLVVSKAKEKLKRKKDILKG